MRRNEMLWFEDVSPLNEPVLSFPVLGRISMRQFFILGMAGMVSYGIFSGVHSPESAIPVCIGAMLTFFRPKVGTAEWMAFSIMRFLLVRIPVPTAGIAKRNVGKKRNGKLGLAVPCQLEQGEASTRVVRVSDPFRPLRFRLRIAGSRGEPLACTKAQVLLDDVPADYAMTDSNGELEAMIVPQTAGMHRISVHIDGLPEPVHQEDVEITVPDSDSTK